jgi:hypothetical protein
MASLNPQMIVRVDIDAEALVEILTDLADVAQRAFDVLIAARDLLDDSQAATAAAMEAAEGGTQ